MNLCIESFGKYASKRKVYNVASDYLGLLKKLICLQVAAPNEVLLNVLYNKTKFLQNILIYIGSGYSGSSSCYTNDSILQNH